MKEDAEPTLHQHFDGLIDEAIQLVKIFNTIAYKIKEMRRIGV
jgi:hypothetical protein